LSGKSQDKSLLGTGQKRIKRKGIPDREGSFYQLDERAMERSRGGYGGKVGGKD
jgi:hypothetical protein